jgi:UDP-GlcNAc:undecaprenyl-phosphate GlcNAc-1-phosphate transferase
MTGDLVPLLHPLFPFFLPLAVSGLLTVLLLRVAPRLGLVDHPNGRKFHRQPTPKGGGLAIYAAVALAVILLPAGRSGGMLPLLGVGFGIVLLGLLDDLRPLPWQFRLGVQTAAAVVVVVGAPDAMGWLPRVAAVFWIVGLVNAFNMLDNMDALSGGVAWIAAAVFAVAAALRAGDGQPAVPYLVLMGALAGFLWFNRPPARIFMGDAGSTFLGFFLSVRSLEEGLFKAVTPTWALPLCVLAVPWYDLASVVLLRCWQGRSPFHADKQHLSHRLVDLGLSSTAAVRVIYLLALASGLSGLLVAQVEAGHGMLVGLQLICWWTAIAAIEYLSRFRTSS